MHAIVKFVRTLLQAIADVRSGGRTATARARTRAARPPRRCPSCHQPVQHSTDPRDHLDDDHPDCGPYGHLNTR